MKTKALAAAQGKGISSCSLGKLTGYGTGSIPNAFQTLLEPYQHLQNPSRNLPSSARTLPECFHKASQTVKLPSKTIAKPFPHASQTLPKHFPDSEPHSKTLPNLHPTSPMLPERSRTSPNPIFRETFQKPFQDPSKPLPTSRPDACPRLLWPTSKLSIFLAKSPKNRFCY